MATEVLKIESVDGYGDGFSLVLTAFDDGHDELDMLVATGSETALLGLSVDQVRTIRDSLTEWLTAVHREAVKRERGSLS